MSRTSFRSTVCLLVLGVAIGARGARAQPAAPAAAAAKTVKNPVTATPASVAAGQATFGKYCKFCHGADAKGNGPLAPKDTHPPDLTDATWTNGATDGAIFASIRAGIGPTFDMKANPATKIPDPDVWNVVNYLRSVGPRK